MPAHYLAAIKIFYAKIECRRWNIDHLEKDVITEKIFIASVKKFMAKSKAVKPLQNLIKL